MLNLSVKQVVQNHWRLALLGTASVMLSACVGGGDKSSSSEAQLSSVAQESSSSVVEQSSSVESSSEAASSSSVVVQPSSSSEASSSSDDSSSEASSSSVEASSSSVADSSSSAANEGPIVSRTSCPTPPPASQDVDLTNEGPYDLSMSKDEYVAMLEDKGTFNGSRGDLPWHMYTPDLAMSNPDADYPLIVSLHGGYGREGEDFHILQDGVPYMLASSNGLLLPENKDKYAAYMIFPQCLEANCAFYSNEWSSGGGADYTVQNQPSQNGQTLIELIEYMVATYNVDPARIYVTGVSMGGGGTWELAQRRPDLVAAAIPLAGHTPSDQFLNTFSDSFVPVWAHAGERDNTNSYNDTVQAVNYIDGQGGCAWLASYDGYQRGDQYSQAAHGHSLWQRVYLNPDLWDWVFAQKQPRSNDPVASSSAGNSSDAGQSSSEAMSSSSVASGGALDCEFTISQNNGGYLELAPFTVVNNTANTITNWSVEFDTTLVMGNLNTYSGNGVSDVSAAGSIVTVTGPSLAPGATASINIGGGVSGTVPEPLTCVGQGDEQSSSSEAQSSSSAASSSAPGVSEQEKAERIAAGKDLFDNGDVNCVGCHGTNGVGGGFGSIVIDATNNVCTSCDSSYDSLVDSLANGISGTLMPACKPEGNCAEQLADYIWADLNGQELPVVGGGSGGGAYSEDFGSGQLPSWMEFADCGNGNSSANITGGELEITAGSSCGGWAKLTPLDTMSSAYIKFDATALSANGNNWFVLIGNGSATELSTSAMRLRPQANDRQLTWNVGDNGDTFTPNFYEPGGRDVTAPFPLNTKACFEIFYDNSSETIRVWKDGVLLPGLEMIGDTASSSFQTRWYDAYSGFTPDVKQVYLGAGQANVKTSFDNVVISDSPIGCN